MVIPPDTDVYLEEVETDEDPEERANGSGAAKVGGCERACSRKSYWRMSNAGVFKRALPKERLINWGFYDLAAAYQALHVNYRKRRICDPYVRCCERTGVKHSLPTRFIRTNQGITCQSQMASLPVLIMLFVYSVSHPHKKYSVHRKSSPGFVS